MTGTTSQIEWADQIKVRVNAEFDRVAKAFHSAAANQLGQDRMDTESIVTILEEKRAEVLAVEHAGYFIRDWGELTDQVRNLIAQDPRYQTVKAGRAARLRVPAPSQSST